MLPARTTTKTRRVASSSLAALYVTLSLLAGCSPTPPAAPSTQPVKLTGTPEALQIVAQLDHLNDQSPAISGIFTWQTTQDQSAHFAEQVYNANPPLAYLNAVPKTPAKESAQTIALRAYTQQMLKDGPPQGTHAELQRYEQRQQGQGAQFYVSRTWTTDGVDYLPPVTMAWDGQSGMRYQPTHRWAQAYTSRDDLIILDGSPAAVRFFSLRLPFPYITGQVTLRREAINGEELVVLHQDLPSLYRDYYLSPKEGYLPRRIIQRMKQKQEPPRHDITLTIERETESLPPTRVTTQIIIPAAPLKFLDWDHGTWDSDTTIGGHTLRPDGKWFITQSTTTYPFFHRTETFQAENLSFAPLPATAFEVHVPPDVPVRR